MCLEKKKASLNGLPSWTATCFPDTLYFVYLLIKGTEQQLTAVTVRGKEAVDCNQCLNEVDGAVQTHTHTHTDGERCRDASLSQESCEVSCKVVKVVQQVYLQGSQPKMKVYDNRGIDRV